MTALTAFKAKYKWQKIRNGAAYGADEHRMFASKSPDNQQVDERGGKALDPIVPSPNAREGHLSSTDQKGAASDFANVPPSHFVAPLQHVKLRLCAAGKLDVVLTHEVIVDLGSTFAMIAQQVLTSASATDQTVQMYVAGVLIYDHATTVRCLIDLQLLKMEESSGIVPVYQIVYRVCNANERFVHQASCTIGQALTIQSAADRIDVRLKSVREQLIQMCVTCEEACMSAISEKKCRQNAAACTISQARSIQSAADCIDVQLKSIREELIQICVTCEEAYLLATSLAA